MNVKFIVGVVTEVNEKEATAKVKILHDEDDAVTYELLILQRTAKGNMSYALPEINDKVLCVLFNEDAVNGYILGSFYDEDNPPPVADKNIFTKVFKDGSKVQFDISTGELIADITGSADIKVGKDLTAEITGDATIKASKVLIESEDITFGGNGALKLVNELHTCFFTGALHNVSTTQKTKGA